MPRGGASYHIVQGETMKSLVRRVLAAVLMLFVSCALAPATALAAGDTSPAIFEPFGFRLELDDIEIGPAVVRVGDEVEVAVACEGGAKVVTMEFALSDDGAVMPVDLTDPDGDGTYTGTLPVYAGMPGGDWHLISLFAYYSLPKGTWPDVAIGQEGGRYSPYASSANGYFARDLSAFGFRVMSDEGDVTPPVVAYESLQATPKRATVGDTVTISAEAYDDFGMSENPDAGIYVYYNNYPHEVIHLTETEPGHFSASFVVTAGMNVGTWRVDHTFSYDDMGNEAYGSTYSENLGGGDFEIYDVPSAEDLFTYDLESATRTPSDAELERGTNVTIAVPVSATNGLKSVTVEFDRQAERTAVELADAGDGTWTGTFMARISGDWVPRQITLVDNEGNIFSTYIKEYWGGDSYPSAPALAFSVSYPTIVDETPPTFRAENSYVEPSVSRYGTPTYYFDARDENGISEVRFQVLEPSETLDDLDLTSWYRTDDESHGLQWAEAYLYPEEVGIYRVPILQVEDYYGNVTTVKNSYYYPDDPEAQDLSMLDFEYVIDDDHLPPEVDLSTLTVTPARATAGDVITFSVTATDVPGVMSLWGDIVPEEGGVKRQIVLGDHDGDTWYGSYTVRATDPSGPWHLSTLSTRDIYWNEISFAGTDVDLSGADFEVYGTTDTTPPELDLESLSATPKRVGQGGKVVLTLSASDDVSGVSSGTVRLRGAGGKTVSTSLQPAGDGRLSATVDLTRSYLSDLNVIGDVMVLSVTLRDNAGNTRLYQASSTTDLSGLGFTVMDAASPLNLENAVVTVHTMPPIFYDGTEKRPDVTVRVGEETLEEGVDYELTYQDNVDAGGAKVTVTALGDWFGLTRKAFVILPRPISAADMNPEQIAPVTYAGSPVTPAIELAYANTTLVEGKDYRLHYSDNDAVGEAMLEVIGRGNFIGRVSVPFKIVDSAPSTVPIYRMYNTKTSEHLYTTRAGEYNACGSGNYADWRQEGVAWKAPSRDSAGARPVYRLYNLKSGDHHYTTSTGERSKLLASGQWRDEGIAFYSADKASPNIIPVYRVYNGRLKRGQHHYTTSAVERDALVNSHGWRDEGVGFYGYKR